MTENKKLTIAQKFAYVEKTLETGKFYKAFPKAEMLEFIAERKEMAKKSATRKSGKPTKAQVENKALAEKVKEYILGTKKTEGVALIFNMTDIFEEMKIEQKGKATSVAKILVEEGFMTDLGVMTVNKTRRKHYEVK